ncbi:ATP-binding protein [Micromonospora sp. BRA006-A]|nr:ATP-binding protein [Micromonospora sp. BRA006-A]
MATLRSALYDDLRPGQTGAVFLTGESGVGKTRLLTEVGEQLRQTGALVLTGTCPTSETPRRCTRYGRRCAGSRPSSPRRAPPRRSAVCCRSSTRRPRPGRRRRAAGTRRPGPARGGRRTAAGARPRRSAVVDRSTRQLLLYLLAGLGDLQLSVLAAIRAESLRGAHPLRRGSPSCAGCARYG